MERAVERDHRGPPRVRARELDRVLDRLRPGVEERRLRRPRERREREQPLGELDVDLVGDDGEVGVGEAVELLLRRGDDLRVGVADVETADAAGEVDERVAVDVGDRRAPGLGGDDGKGERQRRSDAAVDPVDDLPRTRARDLRPEVDRPRRGHGLSVQQPAGPLHT